MTTTTTEYLPIVDVITYDGKRYVYACAPWGTKKQAEQAITFERGTCEGNIQGSYCDTREITMEIKLTEKQQEMMMMIGEPPKCWMDHRKWDSNQVTIYKGHRAFVLRGSHEHRTARSLEDKGLAKVFASQQFGGSGYAISLPFES